MQERTQGAEVESGAVLPLYSVTSQLVKMRLDGSDVAASCFVADACFRVLCDVCCYALLFKLVAIADVASGNGMHMQRTIRIFACWEQD